MVKESSPEKKPKRAPVPLAEKTPRQPQKRKEALDAQAASSERRPKRARVPTQPFQSPVPEFEAIPKALKPTPHKQPEEKLVIFFKNEFLAVRNEEGSFFVCQAVQNVYKGSKKIKVRWMTANGRVYTPDFYDTIDFESILTTLEMKRLGRDRHELSAEEVARTEHILQLDLSLYKDESQLDKRKADAPAPAKLRAPPKPKVPRAAKPKKGRKAKKPPAAARTAPPPPPAAAKKLTEVKPPVKEKKGGSRECVGDRLL
ncbi:titin-like [Pollicipes pollicipes]|uniref:titin-like n=1 Tax=Pollicipes pollicipes TaxID=41117 RepID=UPI001884DD22|nr:titin-like [Pollicipes pollicipes]